MLGRCLGISGGWEVRYFRFSCIEVRFGGVLVLYRSAGQEGRSEGLGKVSYLGMFPGFTVGGLLDFGVYNRPCWIALGVCGARLLLFEFADAVGDGVGCNSLSVVV